MSTGRCIVLYAACLYVCVCLGMRDGGIWVRPSWQICEVSSSRATDTIDMFLGEFCAYCCTFEYQACVHMGVWNEGELTDGGGRVVSGQYHHGPTSPNIIWVLNSGVSGLHTVQAGRKHNKTESERGGEKQMVFMRKRRI